MKAAWCDLLHYPDLWLQEDVFAACQNGWTSSVLVRGITQRGLPEVERPNTLRSSEHGAAKGCISAPMPKDRLQDLTQRASHKRVI
jgi:hypothetical protein